LNPAFSGITSGFVYLQHRQLAPVSISLACDKPLIAIPATLESIIDLVAYGPVYFNGDYSLLSATAHGPLNGEVVPNVTMKVVVDTGWEPVSLHLRFCGEDACKYLIFLWLGLTAPFHWLTGCVLL
jgi:hypothetical protein